MSADEADDPQDHGVVDALLTGGAHGLAVAILPMLLLASGITLTTSERLEVLGAAVMAGAAANALRRHGSHRAPH